MHKYKDACCGCIDCSAQEHRKDCESQEFVEELTNPSNQQARLAYLVAYLLEASKLPTSRSAQLAADLDTISKSDNSDDIYRLAKEVHYITKGTNEN